MKRKPPTQPRSGVSRDRTFQGVTIMDVAQEAGVSYATVSRVVNNKEYVRSDTRDRVMQAIAALGYVANQQARSLAGGRSQIIGLVVRDLGSSYMGEIVRGIDDELSAAHYTMMLFTTHRQANREHTFVTSLAQGMADGLLLVLPHDPDEYLSLLDMTRYPYVLIDHQGLGENSPAVASTNRQGAYDATSYLIRLGHRRIGFITGALDLRSAWERQEGYQQALSDSGIGFESSLISEGSYHQPEGYSGAHNLLSLPQPPTAIFASNDVMAFGVMEAVRERGLRIPGDISIVGFDNIPQASQVAPPLTTVSQPLEQMGREAVRMLLQRIDNPSQPLQRRELQTTLIVRHSCQVLRPD